MATEESTEFKYKPGMMMGYDARFPNTNQSRGCWQYYVDFYRCQKKMGKDYEPCDYFKNTFLTNCPKIWHERWTEWLEEGRMPGTVFKP